jgi:hypothetical protein
MYKNEHWIESYWLEADNEVPRCDDCPHPNGCIRECILEKYKDEDVAKIRDEEQPQ